MGYTPVPEIRVSLSMAAWKPVATSSTWMSAGLESSSAATDTVFEPL